MTDESSTSVFGYADGEWSGKYREDTESIEVVLADKREVIRIMQEESIFAGRAAFDGVCKNEWGRPLCFFRNKEIDKNFQKNL